MPAVTASNHKKFAFWDLDRGMIPLRLGESLAIRVLAGDAVTLTASARHPIRPQGNVIKRIIKPQSPF